LQGSIPTGWTTSFGASSLSLSPGTSSSTSFTVTSPASAADGFYTIGVTATNSANPSYVGSASVTVSVSSGSTSCTRANPTVALSPSTTQYVSPGTSQAYTVTVTNRDSAGCTASSFTPSQAMPVGWTGTFGTSIFTLAPGVSGSTTFTVTSLASATGGSYTIGVTATNSADSRYAGSASVTDVLITSLGVTVAPDRPTYTGNTWVKVTATTTAGGAPVAGASVTFTITKPNQAVITGTATTGANGLASFSFRLKPKEPNGQWQAQGAATAYGKSGSNSTSFVVQ